jgi:hypothetical protein
MMSLIGSKPKYMDDLKDYLNCRILTDNENIITFVIQPYLIKNLREKLESAINNLSDYEMPGTPSFKIVRPIDKTEKFDPDQQSMYRSSLGMLLY